MAELKFIPTESPNTIRIVRVDKFTEKIDFEIEVHCDRSESVPLLMRTVIDSVFVGQVLPLIREAPRLLHSLRSLLALERKRQSQGHFSTVQRQMLHVLMLEVETIVNALDEPLTKTKAETDEIYIDLSEPMDPSP